MHGLIHGREGICFWSFMVYYDFKISLREYIIWVVLQLTSCKLCVTSCDLKKNKFRSCEFLFMSSKVILRVANLFCEFEMKSRVASCFLRVPSCFLRVVSLRKQFYELQVVFCELKI